jgi:Flp pilus assembly protein TadD
VRECPKCGKIIKSDEKSCNDCTPELINDLNESENTKSDNNLDENNNFIDPGKVDESDIELNVNEITDTESGLAENDPMSDEEVDENDSSIDIEDDLIGVDNSPFDEYLERESNYSDSSEGSLLKSDISDQIKPMQYDEAESHQPDDSTGVAQNSNISLLKSQPKIDSVSETSMSSSDRDNLINSLQSKIPGIIQRKQKDTAIMEDVNQLEPIVESEISEPDIIQNSAEKVAVEPEPKTEIFRIPTKPVLGDMEQEDIVYSQGSKLFLPSGITLKDGDNISLAGKSYPMKIKKRDIKAYILAGLTAIIGLFIIVTMMSRLFAPSSESKLIGLVLNTETRAVIADAQIIISEIDQTVYTDNNGLFEINNITDKELSLLASKPQYSTASLGFSIPSGKTDILTIYMDPSLPAIANRDNKSKSDQTEKLKAKKKRSYGDLMVTTEVEDARVIVDNKVLGPSNKVYSKLYTGKHKLVVTKEGFKEYSGTINISSNKTTSINVDLEEIETEYNPTEIGFDQYVEMADNMAAENKWQEAAGQYTMALAKKDDPSTYRKRAKAYLDMGQNRQAVDDLFKAAKYYTLQGMITETIKCYNSILKVYPENSDAFRERGFALLRTGDYSGSLDDLKHAVKLNEKSFENQKALGEALYIMGDYKESVKYLKNARKLNDTNARVYALLALSSMARGKDKDARKYYQGFEMRSDKSDKQEFASDPDWQRLVHIVSQN